MYSTLLGGGFPAEALRHGDCVAAHALLGGPLAAPKQAAEWAQRCRGVFRWSQHFEGEARSAPVLTPTANGNGNGVANGLADGLKKVALADGARH